MEKKLAKVYPRGKNWCESCFYHIHFPWVCKPQLNGGKGCPDWKNRNECKEENHV